MAAGSRNEMLRLGRKLGFAVVLSLLAFAGGCTGFFVNPTLSSLTIGPQNQTITVNPLVKLQMSATGTYSDGSTKDLTGKVLWTSSDTTCATINSNGLVSPVPTVTGICTTTISASMGTVSAATASVMVSEGTPTSITLTVDNPSPAQATSVTFTAKAIFPGGGASQDITSSVTWINSNPTDLTLTQGSGTGTIAAGATGAQINVQASFDGVNSNVVTLTVGP